MKNIWHPVTEPPTRSALIMQSWIEPVPSSVKGFIEMIDPTFYDIEISWETFIQGKKIEKWAYYSDYIKPENKGENKNEN